MRINSLLIVIASLTLCAAVRAQSPVDSAWSLDHGDSLMFHHDGTREYVRANGNREVRFPDQQRLYFFTPNRFITAGAFLSREFRETNAVPQPGKSEMRFRLAAQYSAPKVLWAAFPYGTPFAAQPAAVQKNRAYQFKLAFDDPGWYIVEISATGPGRVTHIIARVLVCVGDHLPLPFDTVVERHAPTAVGRTDARVHAFLGLDRTRTTPLPELDTLRAEAASVLVSAAALQHWSWALVPAARARAILGPLEHLCDSTTSMIAVVTGHTVEEAVWNYRTSPTHRSLDLLKGATRLAIAVTRRDNDVLCIVWPVHGTP